jgi:hypothetical protein
MSHGRVQRTRGTRGADITLCRNPDGYPKACHMTPHSPTYPPDAIPDGAIFGDLTVLCRLSPATNTPRVRYRVRCACGVERPIFGEQLVYGRITSCGRAAHKAPRPARSVRPPRPESPSRPCCGATAFGEVKPLTTWARDPRCVVSLVTVYTRLNHGWSLENALTIPRNCRPTTEGHPLTVFGETKSMAAWARDARCVVSVVAVFMRLKQGWTLEDALTIPRWHRVKRTHNPPTSFAETKSMADGINDSRCQVPPPTLAARVQQGWTVDDALTRSRGKGQRTGHLLTAFGETKCQTEWLRDPRCRVGRNTLLQRLKHGVPLEDALSLPAERAAHLQTAFGETKSLFAWARDPRCVVSPSGLQRRLRKGWTMEAALTRPPDTRYTVSQIITAFGETKWLSEWEHDARCHVSVATIRGRLLKGWSPEDALE